MKKQILILILFISIFTAAVAADGEPYITSATKYPTYVIQNDNLYSIHDSVLVNPVYKTDPASSPYHLSSFSNIRCKSFHPLDPNYKNMIDLITDIEYDSINNVYNYECSKYFMKIIDDEIIYFEFMYRTSQSGPIDSNDWINWDDVEKEMEEINFYGTDVQESLQTSKTAAYDAMMYGSSDLSSYLTSVFTIDTDTINLSDSQAYNKVVLNDDVEMMSQVAISSHIGALFKFLVALQTHYNEISSYIILFAVLSLISGTIFYILKYKKGKADEEFELKKFLSYFLIGLILFAPLPLSKDDDEELIFSSLASSGITTIYQSLNSVSNKLSYFAVDSLVDNMFQNAGFASEQAVKQAIKDKFLLEQKIKFYENISNQCESTYDFLSRSVKEYKNRSYHQKRVQDGTVDLESPNAMYRYFYDTLYHTAGLKEGANRGVSRSYCTKIIHDLPSIKSKLTLVNDGIELYKSSDWKNNERVLTLGKQIYKDLQNDGWTGLPNILIKIIILQQEAQFDINRKHHVEEITSATKELLERSSTMDRMAQTIATYVPFLLLPGSDMVLSVAGSTGIPIVSSVGGVSLAVMYGQQFLEQLPVYVLYIISMITVMVYYVTMLLYSILPYVLLAVIFFPKNYLIIQKYFKTIVIHAFKSPILVLSVFISYVISDFITNFAVTKNSEMYMQNHDLLEGNLTDVPFATTLLFSMMNVLAVILSSILIYILLTKGTSIIYNSIMIDKDQSTSDDEQIQQKTEEKIKSKGV